MPIRVVVADDQPLVRSGLRTILDAQPDIDVIGEAGDGHEAVALARLERPDVVLMDVRMPGLDGIAATRQLAGPDVTEPIAVLVLTTFDLDEHVYDALRAGARGFLLKDATRDELVNGIRVVAAGEALLAPSVTRRLIADFAKTRPAARGKPAQRLKGLTQRETEVLTLVARGRSNTEIAETLVLAEQTVKTHVSRVLTKLGLRDRAQAVVFAYESGLVAPGE
jgi:DNA-binding NarL/FixJ family response regulator